MEDGNGLGVGYRHLLDVHAARGRQHAEVLFGAAIEGEAGVVLAFDVRGVLDPQPLDNVALDVEAEDVAGVGAELCFVVGQLHATGLAPSAHLDLCLDRDRVAGIGGHHHCLVDGVGHTSLGDGQAVAGEDLLALVLEEIH